MKLTLHNVVKDPIILVSVNNIITQIEAKVIESCCNDELIIKNDALKFLFVVFVIIVSAAMNLLDIIVIKITVDNTAI